MRLQIFRGFVFSKIILGLILSLAGFQSFSCSMLKAEEQIEDPLEGFNRKVHWFNMTLDEYLVEPVAKGYDYITPEPVQDGVSNFLENLRFPKYFVNDLLQGEFVQASEHTGRFLINTLLGVGGIIDVAKHVGLEAKHEDFGLTMAKWGADQGAYLVLPFIGPSSVRDGFGKIFDYALDPVTWIPFAVTSDTAEQWYLGLGERSFEIVHERAQLIDAIDTLKESSMDLYLSMQSSYYQYREGLEHSNDPDDNSWADDDMDYE